MSAQLSYTHNGCTTEWRCGRGFLETALPASLAAQSGKRPVIISDARLKDLVAGRLASVIGCGVIYVEGGERAKTAKAKDKVDNLLLKGGYGTDTVIIAVGGGTVLDMAGFTASTYLRGVPLILVPTTLLAVVDASIGGKNGINSKYGKNHIGTLYPPKAVFADLDVLKSLPATEMAFGLSEIVKIGLAGNSRLLDSLGNPKAFDALVCDAAKEKIRVVSEDNERNKVRNILNFGHTIAHGLEHASRYTLPHGTAVGIGCMTEAYLSMLLGHLSERAFNGILPLASHLGPLSLPSSYARPTMLKAMEKDKKATGDGIRFVCLEAMGRSAPFGGDYCRPVETNKISEALTWMEKTYGQL